MARLQRTTTVRLLALGLAACAAPRSEPLPSPAEASKPAAEAPLAAPPEANVHGGAIADAGPGAPPRGAAAAAQVAADSVATDPVAEVLALPPSHSRSLGGPDSGQLQGAVALPERGPGFIHNPRRPHDARHGTVELVQAIVRAAAVVERELPGSGLVVNDLSLPEGGPIAQHGSHQNGRDADILFYSVDTRGRPLPSVGVPIDPEGKGWDFKDLSTPVDDVRLSLDAPRTWRFMQALVEVAGEHLQRIFIVEHVRTMLLEQARRVRAPRAAVERFALVSCQPGTPHDDHMHLRFFCAPDDIAEGCLDKAPIYPWHKQALAAQGLEAVRETWKDRRARRAQVAARTTTREQARQRAQRKWGKLHKRVRDFLELRESWAKKTTPARPYCR
ncbi:MAG: penicillin-insensitive murein endopeptidase [Myxococcales bacterium]|nr:penicillin-insensitive murein endopeptidase [Myxococcales bacterium]